MTNKYPNEIIEKTQTLWTFKYIAIERLSIAYMAFLVVCKLDKQLFMQPVNFNLWLGGTGQGVRQLYLSPRMNYRVLNLWLNIIKGYRNQWILQKRAHHASLT